ncbi:hypothetical protein PTKIN_Ptkin17bG0049400 [Pterospermum kingtungense]
MVLCLLQAFGSCLKTSETAEQICQIRLQQNSSQIPSLSLSDFLKKIFHLYLTLINPHFEENPSCQSCSFPQSLKEKIKQPDAGVANPVAGKCDGEDDFDWLEGLTHWSNFLWYKEVFSDVAVSSNSDNTSNRNNSSDTVVVANEEGEAGGGFIGGTGMELGEFGQMGQSRDGDFAGIDGGENGMLGEGTYNGKDQVREEADDGLLYEEVEPNGSNLKKKRQVLKGLEKKAFGFLVKHFWQLRELEARFVQ